MDNREVSNMESTVIPPTPRRWSDLTRAYLAHKSTYAAPNTIRNTDKPTLATFLRFLGGADPMLTEISREMTDGYVAWVRGRMKPGSARTRIVTLHSIFGFAVDEAWIERNPLRGIKLPPPEFAGRILSDKDLRRLLRQLSDPVRRACILSLYTGMRRGEILALDWSWVRGNILTIPAVVTKAKRSRVIALHPKAIKALGRRRIGPVFNLSAGKINRVMSAAYKALGIGRVRFHDMRHMFASHFMELPGADVFTLCAVGGWKSTASAQPYQHITQARADMVLGMRYAI